MLMAFMWLVCFSTSKTDAANITKLDVEMFHDECWKPIYFGVKSQKVTRNNRRCQRGLLYSCDCWFLV